MAVKDFHILLQCGCLYKNVKVLTEQGFATSTSDVYWILKSKGFIYVTSNVSKPPEKIELKDIYYFCVSNKY